MHVEGVQQLVQGVRVLQVPVLVIVQNDVLCDLEPLCSEPTRTRQVGGIIEDRHLGGEVPVDIKDIVCPHYRLIIKRQKKVSVNRWDVVCHVSVGVEVVTKVTEGERVDAMSCPASKHDEPLWKKVRSAAKMSL